MNGTRHLQCTVLLILAGFAAGNGAAAEAQQAVVPPAVDKNSNATEPDPIEEIEVHGTRSSLIQSRDDKLDASVIMDTIVAEDLGLFPDANVADSLSHITGITIQRTRGGEGQYVNVRGLGPEYNIVTLNNRILATDGDGREFAFDVLPAEVITTAE
ncbi:MAG: TonB-dependent receptor plug domain-containing protein, partial [Lysobacterales bacterium]